MSQYLHLFLNSRVNKLKRHNNYEIIVLGLSYATYGIVENQMNKKCIKLALPSQDLYYDNIIIKNVLKSKGKIKYCILGMAYYSFDYDLKFTEPFNIWNIYYPIFKDSHHLELPNNYLLNKKDKFKLKNLYTYFVHTILTPDIKKKMWNKNGLLVNGPIETMDEAARLLNVNKRILSHNKLNFPQTRKEYEAVFANTLELLLANDIKPILVIFPTTKYYSDIFDTDIINRFYSITGKLEKTYDFQLIDMFRDTRFCLNDFLDWDHLNKTGAKKMTRYLNDAIIW